MDTGALQSALGALGLLRTVVLVLAVVMLAAVLALAVAHTLSEKRSRGRGEQQSCMCWVSTQARQAARNSRL
jgi:preprotein translocase subunit SecG